MDPADRLRRIASDALAETRPGYPVWRSGGPWHRGGATHWAAGFAVAMCDGPPVRLPEDAPVGGFSGFSGYYGRSPGLADRVRAAMLPCGAIGVVEPDLVGSGGDAYIDAVGPTAALVTELDPVLAARHAHWTLDALQQPDGSVRQIALFESSTGRLLGTRTGRQGLTARSRWSRAQAWGLLAAAMAGPIGAGTAWDVSAHGRRLARWWRSHCDPDRLPPWDFDARSGPADSSAAAIAAAALLRMAGGEGDRDERTALRRHAERLVRTMLGAVDDRGALLHGCYDRSLDLATDAELIWGDAYLLEALQLL